MRRTLESRRFFQRSIGRGPPAVSTSYCWRRLVPTRAGPAPPSTLGSTLTKSTGSSTAISDSWWQSPTALARR